MDYIQVRATRTNSQGIIHQGPSREERFWIPKNAVLMLKGERHPFEIILTLSYKQMLASENEYFSNLFSVTDPLAP